MMAEKTKHLGRGLESLLGPITSITPEENEALSNPEIGTNFFPDKQLSNSIRDIPLDLISPNPYQPRSTWNEQDLAKLADSIKSSGVIQPIIVRPLGKKYQIIAGERRFRAAEIVSLSTIPAIVRQADDDQMLELALIENIHRTDLNPMERAKAYQNYLNSFSLTQAEASERLGENRSVVANYLRLLDLPEEIKQMLEQDKLSMGHARAILALPTDQLRRKLANRALSGRLSVREVERLVRKHLTGSENAKNKQQKPPHIVDLETKLSRQLGTKVSIQANKNGHKGRIIIEFYSIDEFDRIAESIGLSTLEEV